MPISLGLFMCAPEGRKSVAQGVSPGTRSPHESLAPEGRKNLKRWPSVAPCGAPGEREPPAASPRLAPWALSLRPCGATGDSAKRGLVEKSRYTEANSYFA
jgi:hypothetical protein